jgi:hypothetical protein
MAGAGAAGAVVVEPPRGSGVVVVPDAGGIVRESKGFPDSSTCCSRIEP